MDKGNSRRKFESPTGTYMYDLEDPKDFQEFAQIYGGEKELKKYPQLWKAVTKNTGRKNTVMNGTRGFMSAGQAEPVNRNSDIKIEGSISPITAIGIESKSASLPKNAMKATLSEDAAQPQGIEICNFYKLATEVEVSYGNESEELTTKSDREEAPIPVAYSMVVKVVDDSTGMGVFMKKFYYEDDTDSMRLLDNITTDMIPYEKLNGRNFTMTVDVVCELQDGSIKAAKLAPRSISMPKAVAQSYINKITINAPHWKSTKKSGNIVFFYGRSAYGDKDADYSGNEYLKNTKGEHLRTIIPISGTIKLNNLKHKVTGVSIDSYICGKEVFPKFYLDYNISGGRKTIAEHGKNVSLDSLGQILQDNEDLTYDSATNTVTFDLKLPVQGSMLGPYDWNSNIDGAFLNDSSHTCFLNGCFVLRVEHEPSMGSTFDRYAIFIYSAYSDPHNPLTYYECNNGETTVFIPPIEIYWGCFARETLIRTVDGSTKRADEIMIGDKIPALGDKMLTVADILTGEDAQIVRIVTEDGNKIRVSDGHAMLLHDVSEPAGRRVAAGKIQAGDRLMTPYGVSVVSEVETEPYNDTVYNYIFAEENEPNYIEANGYWSGDFHAQNEKKEKKPVEITEEARILMKELRELSKQ